MSDERERIAARPYFTRPGTPSDRELDRIGAANAEIRQQLHDLSN